MALWEEVCYQCYWVTITIYIVGVSTQQPFGITVAVTSPQYYPVCPGDDVVVTCTLVYPPLAWRSTDHESNACSTYVNGNTTGSTGSFSITPGDTLHNSTATLNNIQLSQQHIGIRCYSLIAVTLDYTLYIDLSDSKTFTSIWLSNKLISYRTST